MHVTLLQDKVTTVLQTGVSQIVIPLIIRYVVSRNFVIYQEADSYTIS